MLVKRVFKAILSYKKKSKVPLKKTKVPFSLKFEKNPYMEACIKPLWRPPCGDFS